MPSLLCISSKETARVSGKKNKTVKNCNTAMEAKNTKGAECERAAAALTTRADDVALHRSAAEMDIMLGNTDDAKVELGEAAKLNPGNSETEYLLGQVCAKTGRTEEAVRHLKTALSRDPNLLQARAPPGHRVYAFEPARTRRA